MNCLAKLMIGLITERLSNWSEKHNILNEFQAGFRKNYSTADNIYILSSVVHLNFSQGRKTYAFFVDFKAAFDKVPRKALIYKLHSIGISTKVINFIERIYENTVTSVWTGNELSDEFKTSSGVKQGCLLSPLLFAFYLNDLHDALGGGMNIGDFNIRVLLYADDIVILADDVAVLQGMIYKLEEYCTQWNMEVNLNKSQIMIFRKGGRISRDEKWTLNGNNITVTSEYCYLGVTLTPKMVFKKHIEKRNMAAKNCINATWKDFLQKRSISLKSKWKLFLAVCRAIQTYGAQVWGFSNFEEVDKLSNFFVKKMLRLPNFTPTYILMLETGYEYGHLYTLDLHLRYIAKTLFIYTENRLPHQLTKKLLQRKINWVNDLNNIGAEFNITWSEQNCTIRQWQMNKSSLFQELRNKYMVNLNAKVSQTSRIYKDLDIVNGQRYLIECTNQEDITWIFKARSDLISLNGNSFQNNSSHICSLCNSNEEENLKHFIGRCSALREFRLIYFNKVLLDDVEIFEILNGYTVSWKTLARYLKICVQYRKNLIDEFNY